jgi:hypothetical protein
MFHGMKEINTIKREIVEHHVQTLDQLVNITIDKMFNKHYIFKLLQYYGVPAIWMLIKIILLVKKEVIKFYHFYMKEE